MYRFDRVTVSLETREVLVDGNPCHLGARAFDILEMLISANGKVVSKDEIMKAVWPNLVVVDNNIQVQISALRKLFGGKHGWIKTIAGRGYTLTASLDNRRQVHAAGTTITPLITPRCSLIGRDSALAELHAESANESLITLVGPGGVGKTALAREFAQGWSARTGGRVRYIDLAESNYESALRAALSQDDSEGSSCCLTVVDSCEHSTDEAAAVCEELLDSMPLGRVVATSREPLRVADEFVLRVAPLSTHDEKQDGAEGSVNPAVHLFLRRAGMNNTEVARTSLGLSLVSAACRRLDGLPLAIELAAQQASVIGIGPLLEQLGPQFLDAANRMRGKPERHRTMATMLDWSYQRLDKVERTLLCALSALDSSFDVEAVRAVACYTECSENEILQAFAGLVNNSLVSIEVGQLDARVKYRVLQTTRWFALRKSGKVEEEGRIAFWPRHYAGQSLQETHDFRERDSYESGVVPPTSIRHIERANV